MSSKGGFAITFEDLRRKGFTYVDKAAQILWLADNSVVKQFFLARPRRFGKSLLISTMHALFEGRRDLFTGLAIEDKWDWSRRWPVLHLDMGSCQAETVEGLWDAMDTMLMREATRLNLALRGNSIPAKFGFLIDDLAARNRKEIVAAAKAEGWVPPDDSGRMVLLIDEYDKPLLGHLSRPDVTQFKNALKEFYSIVKTLESRQRFAFITGVSKFSKVPGEIDYESFSGRSYLYAAPVKRTGFLGRFMTYELNVDRSSKTVEAGDLWNVSWE